MLEQEVYKSSALGPIRLSFTGRHLLQNLREAMTELVAKVIKENKVVLGEQDWEPVSVARGQIAKYMGRLEQRNDFEERNSIPPPQPPQSAYTALVKENECLSEQNKNLLEAIANLRELNRRYEGNENRIQYLKETLHRVKTLIDANS